jgi:hypothetical protein
MKKSLQIKKLLQKQDWNLKIGKKHTVKAL